MFSRSAVGHWKEGRSVFGAESCSVWANSMWFLVLLLCSPKMTPSRLFALVASTRTAPYLSPFPVSTLSVDVAAYRFSRCFGRYRCRCFRVRFVFALEQVQIKPGRATWEAFLPRAGDEEGEEQDWEEGEREQKGKRGLSTVLSTMLSTMLQAWGR